MTDIVKARALGMIQNNQPVTGSGTGDPGLADPLARMSRNWNLVLKGQLGFNNPENETGRFSLRTELFRTQTNNATSKDTWQTVLRSCWVPNLFDLPEWNRYCISFSPAVPPEPALVIPFASTVTFGDNFFGWPLGGNDSAYDSSHFATKIRGVGVWFANYNNLAMSLTPRVYLVPAGVDILRSPTDDFGVTREWRVVDQLVPVPFVNPDYKQDPNWIPINSMLDGTYADIRKFASFRAYHDGGFNVSEMTYSTRLVGRSVWNTKWLLIIPGGTLLSDRTNALDTFIYGLPSSTGTVQDSRGQLRDGNGVSEIKLYFQTYSYSGN